MYDAQGGGTQRGRFDGVPDHGVGRNAQVQAEDDVPYRRPGVRGRAAVPGRCPAVLYQYDRPLGVGQHSEGHGSEEEPGECPRRAVPEDHPRLGDIGTTA
ncbi:MULTISPECIES: hypothetical protein [Streptomyces]|uniref:Uncharacterized protein n=1 Tax=Streptomyces ortus TaxID=2867268 RepID=A0ABT3VKC8_9ACTN|nr:MULTISPECIES: hypothetical protein [Streptomyces]MCX4238768.1 hypothetical protein [Streptomyces ortus]